MNKDDSNWDSSLKDIKPLTDKDLVFVKDMSMALTCILFEVVEGNNKLAVELAMGIPTMDIMDAHRLIYSLHCIHKHQTQSNEKH